MNNSRKVNGNLNVVGNKIRYYREKNNMSYQKLSDQLRERLYPRIPWCAVPQCRNQCDLSCGQSSPWPLYGQLWEVRGNGGVKA